MDLKEAATGLVESCLTVQYDDEERRYWVLCEVCGDEAGSEEECSLCGVNGLKAALETIQDRLNDLRQVLFGENIHINVTDGQQQSKAMLMWEPYQDEPAWSGSGDTDTPAFSVMCVLHALLEPEMDDDV